MPRFAFLPAVAILLPLAAYAAPVDPVVRAGTATFAINGNVYTVTNAPNTIIDWRSFNVANGELLRFLQQNPQSVVLNRVTGNDPSQLFGLLQSNGRVVLVNPHGILFGPNAQVDVAGLIASTLNLSDADFLAGRMAFNGGGAALNNQGRITTPLGGSVMLLGGDVSNSGVISAPGGRILLAAGQSVSLADSGTPGLTVTLKADGNQALNLGELNAQGGSIDLYGALVNHQGIARADSAVVDARGNIVLKASGEATVSGTLSAANSAGKGGAVQVLGDSVTLGGAARIDASGRDGGGTVLVGGDFKGANPAVPNARTATVAAGARIDASATGHGDGGKVVVWSNDKTDYAGSIMARGGALGGNGGQVETSGKLLSFDQGRVNTLAPNGKTGNWLLDPAVFCFYHTSAGECTGAAAAGATNFNTLGNILVSTGGTLEATDFITFLPAGGNAAVSNSIPSGLTLNVKAPYIQLGNGSNIDTKVVGVRLDASNAYGTTTQTGAAGANLTGTIDVGGNLTSNASQTLLSTGNINLVHGGTGYTALRMTSASGTQSLSTTGELLLAAGSGNDASGQARQTALFSDGAQTINAAQLTLRAGDTAGAAGNHTEISAKGSQTINTTGITLTAGASGWAIISDDAAGATQTIKADRIALTGGSAGVDNRAVIITSGNNSVQDVTATTSLDVNGGAGGLRNLAIIRSAGSSPASASTQKITAGAIKVTGGGGAGGNYATIYTPGVQNITAASLAVSGGNSGATGTVTGSAPYAAVSGDAGQTLNVSGALSLTGGAGDLGSYAELFSEGNQAINAASLLLQAGGSGKGNHANIAFGNLGNVTQKITANSITMQAGNGTNNYAGIHAHGANLAQTVTAGTLNITGGGGATSGNWAHLWLDDTAGVNAGKQTIAVGTISMTGGSGGTDQNAMIGGNANQKVSADSITLTGGAGVGAGAAISTSGNQSTAVKGALAMTGGSNNNAEARIGGSGTVDVTADSITMQGGSAGNRAIAEINGSKNVSIAVTGVMTLTGGTGGTGNTAAAASGAGLAINTGALTMRGASAGSGNSANLNSATAMALKATGAITVAAGSGANNSAAMNSGADQVIEAGSLSITGGSGGSGNHANISINNGTDALQKITVATFTMLGGQGGSDNIAGLHANGTRVTQEVNAGVLNLTGGKGGGNWAHIASGYQDLTPSTQRLNFGSMVVTGGGAAGDTGNDATVLNYGNQTIKGASLALTGGTGQRAQAHVSNSHEAGLQNVELTGALTIHGGTGTNAGARLIADGTQSLKADSITLLGGTGSGNQAASILAGGMNRQDQTVTTRQLSMTGGGGHDGGAYLYLDGGGLQKVTITGGGSIVMQGGTGAITSVVPAGGYCSGCALSSNVASLFAVNKSSQLIDFVAGGTLTLKGGSNGASNAASIAVEPGANVKQTITSSGGAANYPVISLTGGAGGFYNSGDGAEAGNVAAIGSLDSFTPVTNGMLKTINAKSVTLIGGTTSQRGGATLAIGPGDAIINVTGDVTMTGGPGNIALQMAANPAHAYTRDLGSVAGIVTQGNLDAAIGGNLTIHGGSGASGLAGIATRGSSATLKLAVAGATRITGNNAQAGILSGLTMSDDIFDPGWSVIDIGTGDTFSTGTLAISSRYVGLGGVLNVTSAASDAQLVGDYSGGTLNAPGWRALGAKPIVAEIFASDGIEVGDNTAINTPNGSWIAVLGKNAAASVGASENTLTYNALASHGYQWTTAAYNAGNAQDFRFILPDNSPVVEVHADAAIAQAACTANPALCVTPPIAAATPTSAVAPVVIDVTLTGGVDETPLSASLAQNKADTPPAVAAAPKVQGPRVAAREREAARAEQQKKSTADLKREARDAAVLAKASQEAARKAALAAQKEAAEAKRLAAAAAKTEAQAARATAAVGAAEGDLRAAEADARDARAALGAATTPALKNQAQLRLATAEAARAGAEAKLADARARRSELGAQGSEAGARSAQADATVLDARSREAAAEAKLADLAHKEALVRAREAKDPVSRAAAERVADDKRIEATQRSAESDVRKSLADDLRFASEQGKAQADARQAQAQAAQAMAQARRDEMRLQRAVARARQEEVLAAAKGSAAGGAGRTAQGGKDAAEKLVAAEAKRAEASQSAANAKAQAAEGKQRKAEDGMAEVARRDAARRERAVKAFVAGANASMTANQLAQLAALRHEYKGVLFKDALKVLEQNGRAADLPACGGNISNTCMPSFAQARMEWPTARPLVRRPVAASLPQIERKVAIVIGINQYADQRIPQLDTAVPDADAVARQLETSMGYETRVLRNATRGEIVAALQNVSRELDPNDSLVVYYAGHGYLRAVPKGPAQGYWIPADGQASNPANWISNADVSKLLANIPAKQVMLVSDSCYSGAFSKEQKVGAAGDPSSILARRSVVVMSSGGEEPVSDEGVEGHSIFAWSLMQSLKKVGQVEPGSRVFDATREQVTAAYPQVPQYGAAVSAGHAAGGDYLFETRTYK
jgi:filamentous hemagglutinin family protein